MRNRLATVVVVAMLFALAPAATAFAQQPDNDAFAAATEVGDIPFEDQVDVSEATVEAGEPLETCAPFANTVWYAVTLDADTDLFVNSAGSDYDTAIAVWTGDSLFELSNVACVDDTFNSLQAAVTFAAQAGVTYFVQVGSFGEVFEGGNLVLTIDEPPKTTGKPEIFKFDSRGSGASAFIGDFDPETGAESFTDVFLREGREKVLGERPYQAATLSFSHFGSMFNAETGEFTFVELFGFTELMPSQFAIDRQLRTANVTADLIVQGITCTESPHEPNGNGFEFETVCTEIGPETVTVDVEWEGAGNVFKSRFTDRFSTEGFRSTFRSTSTSRSATAMGSVTGETLFFDLNGANGDLFRDSSAQMQVVRGGLFLF